MVLKLRVQNFRKHRDFTVDFTGGTSLIVGPNGSGKTSLMEAIYVALQGKSWRSNFAEILRDGASWWRVDVWFRNGDKRVVRYQTGQKTFEINEKTYGRLPTSLRKPTVLFEPNDLNLLYGSPSRRRDFFDRFIAQVEPNYQTTLNKFERVLKQRNNLLKQGARGDELFAWDIQFADLAAHIIMAREKWVQKIDTGLTGQYCTIANTNDKITVRYQAPQKTKQQILTELRHEAAQNLPLTGCGPQKHDMVFKINQHSAKLTASRGESRTIVFATLAIMANLLHDKYGAVYTLLDDIDSELDDVRRKNLHAAKIFQNDYLFITAVKSRVRQNVIKLT